MDPVARLEPSVYFAPTVDRWELALYRYGQSDPSAPAAILAGGYACNRHFMDFDERYSLARYLAHRGFDTWVVEFRGRGRSRPLRGCKQPGRWTFDDLALIDVPTVIAFVSHELGHRRFCWIGHSMGGVLMYAYLGTETIGLSPTAAVALATPVQFPRTAYDLVHSIGSALLSVPFPGRVPQRAALGVLWHLVGWSRALEIGMNPDNVDRAVVGAALRRSLSNGSRAELQQLSEWSNTGTFTSVDGAIDYRANLRRVTIPSLVVAGPRDRLAPPEAAERGYELLASPKKRFVVLDRESSFSADYGHVDIVFGRRAPDEVFPLIADWAADSLVAEAG
jgi:pimeloyl-ACP methyl ester carboxylesterase